MAIPSLSFAAEGGKHHKPKHRIPFAGELVEVTDTTLTISLTAERDLVQKVLEKRGYVEGDQITFSITDDTRLVAEDVEPDDVDLEDYEVGTTIFIAGGESDEGEMVARFVSDHAPKRHHRGPGGEIVEVDIDANTLVLETRSGNEIEVTYTDETEFLSKTDEVSESSLEEGIRIGLKFEEDENGEKHASVIFFAPHRE